MADVFVVFDEPITAPDGSAYMARVLGAPARDGMWDGWLEFVPRGGDGDADRAPVRTDRETKQPRREDVEYWGTGLSYSYLEGALRRAFDQTRRRRSRPVARGAAPAAAVPPPRAIIDPFAVYAQGERLLRQELSALSADHLRNVLRAYNLDPTPDTRRTRAELVEVIVSGVRRGDGSS
jgi:hypothetical protein